MPISNKGNPNNFVGVYTVALAPTVATLPTLAPGDIAYFTNALNAAETTGNGTGNLAFWSAISGGSWRRVDTGAAIGA